MATINGKPSIFITPVTPVPVISPADYATAFVDIATEMATQAEPKTDAEFDALCDAHDAEVEELVSLGDSALHAIAGHDAVWQQGGVI